MSARLFARCRVCSNLVAATHCPVCKTPTVREPSPIRRLPMIVPGEALLCEAQQAAAETGTILQCKGDRAVLHDKLLPGYTDISCGVSK